MTHDNQPHAATTLSARRLKWHAQDEAIVLMRTDCPVCRSEGLTQILKSAMLRHFRLSLMCVNG